MNKWGCAGLLFGAWGGLLLAALLLLLTRPVAPPSSPLPPTVPPDISIFLSERSLSRIAAEGVGRPTVLDFDANGQVAVTTRVELGRLEPLVQVGLRLEMDGTRMVSRLRWMQIGFLTIPARWLPAQATETAARVGQTIQTQTPPDFTVVGLATSPEGVTIQLKWVGR